MNDFVQRFVALIASKDEHGNELVATPDGGLHLHLASGERRFIGVVGTTEKGVPFYDKEVKESNRFRKNDSWGLNWMVLEALPTEAVLRLRSEAHTYLITAGHARLAGTFLWFKNQGFERQFFVPIADFEVK